MSDYRVYWHDSSADPSWQLPVDFLITADIQKIDSIITEIDGLTFYDAFDDVLLVAVNQPVKSFNGYWVYNPMADTLVRSGRDLSKHDAFFIKYGEYADTGWFYVDDDFSQIY